MARCGGKANGGDPFGPPACPNLSRVPCFDPTLEPFDEWGQVTLAANQTWTNVALVVAPMNKRGYFEQFGIDTDDSADFQTVEWRIQRSGATIGREFTAHEAQGGIIPPYLIDFPMHFAPTQYVALQVRNIADAEAVVRGRIRGVFTCEGADKGML